MISGRPPKRSDSGPAIGATIIGIPVHGSVRRPALSGEKWSATCRNWASRKIEPNIPAENRNDATLVAVNPRLANSRSGSIGVGARSSQAANAASRMTPATIGPST